ncbi:nitroreductase family protein [Bauldia sp.]|uniref:nitroreductase family protein n=1 Tax=Bauldia sp. TaxID=2575872 RepID=UPI003BA9F7E9
MDRSSNPLKRRYGDDAEHLRDAPSYAQLADVIARGSCRSFTRRDVSPQLVEVLCAAALASPTKSDLQQRDIVIMRDPAAKQRLIALIDTESWVSDVPNIAVFCGNNRRQRRLHDLRQRPFANDHLDAFFNASVDAAIALAAFVNAAEAVGLGCCPISAVRNRAGEVSDLLSLPDQVFPVAGLAFGYPDEDSQRISPRLPLKCTVHIDRFADKDLDGDIEAYDRRREATAPYAAQRATEVFGTAQDYGWSEDKARQYALKERADFGAFVRSKGFRLD